MRGVIFDRKNARLFLFSHFFIQAVFMNGKPHFLHMLVHRKPEQESVVCIVNSRGIALLHSSDNLEVFSWREITGFGPKTHKFSNDSFAFSVPSLHGSETKGPHAVVLMTPHALNIHQVCICEILLVLICFILQACVVILRASCSRRRRQNHVPCSIQASGSIQVNIFFWEETLPFISFTAMDDKRWEAHQVQLLPPRSVRVSSKECVKKNDKKKT